MAEIFGNVAYKMSKRNLHIKYQKEFITYFLEICDHKQDVIRKWAAYNLPCIHLLYKA